MFRPPPCLVIALLAIANTTLIAADPGAGLPLFRRGQSSAPSSASPKKQTAPPATQQDVTPVGVTAEATQGAEVDSAEVIRRGDRAVLAGRGPMSPEEQLIGDATAPPPDDSHKWFFSVIVDDSRESQALLYDLKHSEHLRAWINLDEPKQSWSHATVYVAKDQTQDWRWAKLKITRYPVVILQPPAKLRDEKNATSWEFGDPKTVVWQWDGYDATSPSRAQLRSDAIRKALTLYVQRLSQRRSQDQVVGPRSRAVPPPTPGARQAATPGAQQEGIGGPPPFQLPVFPSTPSSNPVFPSDPTPPSPLTTVATDGIADLAGRLLTRVFGSPTTWLAFLAGLKIFELVARRTKTKMDDSVAAFLHSVVAPVQPTNPIKIDPQA